MGLSLLARVPLWSRAASSGCDPREPDHVASVDGMGRRSERIPGNRSASHDPVVSQLLDAVDRAVETRWSAAQSRAQQFAGSREERVEAATAKFRRELGAAGAASGGTAAIPGVGLGTVAASFAVELGWSTMRLADLILTIAVIHGHDRADVDERRLWVLSVLTYRDGAAGAVARLATELTGSPGERGARQLTHRTIRQINSTIGAGVISKYGSRRVVAALGRAVPFGIGAAVGYGMNTRVVTMTATHAHSFFTDFPIAMDAIDTDGVRVERATPTRSVPPGPGPDPAAGS